MLPPRRSYRLGTLVQTIHRKGYFNQDTATAAVSLQERVWIGPFVLDFDSLPTLLFVKHAEKVAPQSSWDPAVSRVMLGHSGQPEEWF